MRLIVCTASRRTPSALDGSVGSPDRQSRTPERSQGKIKNASTIAFGAVDNKCCCNVPNGIVDSVTCLSTCANAAFTNNSKLEDVPDMQSRNASASPCVNDDRMRVASRKVMAMVELRRLVSG